MGSGIRLEVGAHLLASWSEKEKRRKKRRSSCARLLTALARAPTGTRLLRLRCIASHRGVQECRFFVENVSLGCAPKSLPSSALTGSELGVCVARIMQSNTGRPDTSIIV